MSERFSVLVARAAAKQPHRPIMTIAREVSERLNAASKAKRERAKRNQPKLYATKTSWSSNYDQY